MPLLPLAARVNEEFELDDEDRMKGDEVDVLLGDMFSWMELFSAA